MPHAALTTGGTNIGVTDGCSSNDAVATDIPAHRILLKRKAVDNEVV